MLLFNLTMAVTLTATAVLLPGRPGLDFGIPCLALFVGMLPIATEFRLVFDDGVVNLWVGGCRLDCSSEP
jgi:hypothetical protein